MAKPAMFFTVSVPEPDAMSAVNIVLIGSMANPSSIDTRRGIWTLPLVRRIFGRMRFADIVYLMSDAQPSR